MMKVKEIQLKINKTFKFLAAEEVQMQLLYSLFSFYLLVRIHGETIGNTIGKYW